MSARSGRQAGPARARAATLLLACLGLFACGSVAALQPDEILPDPRLEARARTISAEVRCLVCQNQSIDDSDAPLARDLRILVRERLVAGDSDAAVRDFVVRRYGEFVLLKPLFGLHTLVLWLGPVLVVGAASCYLLTMRRRASAVPPESLTADEEARLRTVLERERG